MRSPTGHAATERGLSNAIFTMNWAANCLVLIPCFNEAASIAALVRDARRHLPHVVVVDDGSSDATADIAGEAGATVIMHPLNRGKGAALKTGFAEARRFGATHALLMDGDGQHWPGDIPAFLRCAEVTGAPLIIGNRMHDAAAIPWLRRGVNRWMSRRISERSGRAIPDSQCGFRMVDLAALNSLSLHTDHFEIESEIVLAFARAGLEIQFVPIRVIGRARRSKIRPLQDTWRWWKWWRATR